MARYLSPRGLWVAILVLLTLAGCASTAPDDPSRQPSAEEILRQVARERGLEPAEVPVPNQINDEMRAWLGERVRKLGSSMETLNQLVRELQEPRQPNSWRFGAMNPILARPTRSPMRGATPTRTACRWYWSRCHGGSIPTVLGWSIGSRPTPHPEPISSSSLIPDQPPPAAR